MIIPSFPAASRYFLQFLLITFLFHSCSTDEDPKEEIVTPETKIPEETIEPSVVLKSISLTASTDTIISNGEDKIHFTVEVYDSEERLVEDAAYNINVNGLPLEGDSFSSVEEAEFSAIATIEDLSSEELQFASIHPNALVTSLDLEANTRQIIANEHSEAELYVVAKDKHGQEVTGAEYELQLNSTTFEGQKFRTAEAGIYSFMASIGEVHSDEILIEAMVPKIYEELSIPVIFHVVHFGDAPGTGNNLSSQQVQRVLERLNRGFSNSHPSTNPNGVDTYIRFRMARLDPENQPLNELGINRIDATSFDVGSENLKRRTDRPWPVDERASNFTTALSTYEGDLAGDQQLGQDESYELGKATMWDMKDYLNIYILPIQQNLGIWGYAYYPLMWESNPLEGMTSYPREYEEYVNYRFEQCVIATEAALYEGSTTVVHEVGHNLGLIHNFSEDACQTSDYCTDTYSYVQNQPSTPCGDNLGLSEHDNFMDYIGQRNTFTYQQRERMRQVFESAFYYTDLKRSGK